MIVNGYGALMMIAGLVAGFGVGGLVDLIWPKSDSGVPVGGMAFFLVAVSSDLIYRCRYFRERGRLRFVHPLTGGMFAFVPIWIFFGLAPLIALPIVLILNPPKKLPPPRVTSGPPGDHMECRPLGKTGLNVSILGQGGAAFGQQYGAVTAAEVADTVRAATDAGVNLMDTAAYYGKGVAEDYLGRALEGGLREKVLVCTKACRLDAAEFDFTPDGTRRCVEASLRRLRTDRVDILLAHDIEFATDYEYVFNETYDVLRRLKDEGKTRFIGMSCYPLGLLKQAVERCDLDVVISYAHYNLFNTRLLTELLPAAEAKGTGVLNASPLAMGLLTNQGPQPWFPGQPEVREACRKAAELCRGRGADISFLGMQFCCAEKHIPCTLTGAARKSELDINLRAMAEPIDRTLLADVMKVLGPVRDWTWPSGNWKG